MKALLLAGTILAGSALPAAAQQWVQTTLGGRSFNIMVVDNYDPAEAFPLVILAEPATHSVWVLGQDQSAQPTYTPLPAIPLPAIALSPGMPTSGQYVPVSPVDPQTVPQEPVQAGSKPTSQPAAPVDVAAIAALPPMPSAAAVCAALPSVGTLIPCGPLHTVGSQILAGDTPIRPNGAAFWSDVPNWDQQMLTIVLSGFNLLRVSFYNRSINDDLDNIDRVVTAAANVGLRVVIDNHANEGGGDCVAQQANGLWYSEGGASGGNDGCGQTGTTDQKWVSDWATVAARYKGNQTVIGYDLKNEPTNYGKGSNWGSGDIDHDIRLAYQRAGTAIQRVDPTKLIIAEGSQNYPEAPEGDLSGVAAQPLILPVPNMVVYSVHEYPKVVGGAGPDSGPEYVARMERVWGYLVRGNIAPVWVGESGASMNSPDQQAWADTFNDYINNLLPSSGWTEAQRPQPVGRLWWMWSSLDGQNPNGALLPDKVTVRDEQSGVFSQTTQRPLVEATEGGSAAFGDKVTILSGAAAPAGDSKVQPSPSIAVVGDASVSTTPSGMISDTQSAIADGDAAVARADRKRGRK